MELAALIHQYHSGFIDKYGDTAFPGHLRALGAIQRCRTPESGELYVQCPDCDHAEWRPLSCGNRNCPKCQNHQSSLWIDKQREKLLPVPYFMATFTLPFELRQLTIDVVQSKGGVFSFIQVCCKHLKGFWLKSKKPRCRIWSDNSIAYQ